jgi:hypothetical protein
MLAVMLCLGLSLYLTTNPRPFSPENRRAVERAVYRAVLDSAYTVVTDSSSRSLREIMLMDHFAGLGGPAPFDSLVAHEALEWLRDSVRALPPATITAFAQQMGDTSSIAGTLVAHEVADSSPNLWMGTRAALHLVADSTLRRFFAPARDHGTGWTGFRDAFPNSTGIVSISRIGLSPDGRWAIMYAGEQSDWLAGGGYVYVLRRRGRTWRIIASRMLWVS